MKKRRKIKTQPKAKKTVSGLYEPNSIGAAPTTNKVASEFSATAYAIKFVAGAFTAIGAIVGINEAAKISPAISTLAGC